MIKDRNYLRKEHEGAPRQAQPRPTRPGRPKRKPGAANNADGPNRRRDPGKRRGTPSSTQPNPVTKLLTPKDLGRETRQSTSLKFRPLEKAVKGDIRASDKRVEDQGDWWKEYLAQVDGSQADTAAAYAAAGEQNAANIGAAAAGATTQTTKLNEEAAASAALRGGPVSSAPAATEAAAASQRSYLAAAQGARVASEGAAQRSYLSDKKRIGVGQSIKARTDEQARGRTYRSDLRDVAKERGEYATTKRGELRSEDRDYLIQKGIAKLDTRKQSADEREGAQSRREDRRSAAETRRHNRATEANTAADNARQVREGETGGGKTRAEREDTREGQANANATARRLIKGHGRPHTPKEWADLEEAVAKESEVSPAEARRAVARIKAQTRSSAAPPPSAGERREHSGRTPQPGVPSGPRNN